MAKRQFKPRDQDFVIPCSTYLPIKKVVSCHVHPQKVFWTIFVFSFSNLRNFQLESEV